MRAGLLVPMVTVAASVALYLFDPPQLQALRHSVFDQYQRWDARTYADSPVRVVDIDDQSLAKLGQWPWPRTRVAELVGRLQAAGAAAITFDIVFAEPDRTSPAAMIQTWKPDKPLRTAISVLPDHDAVLARAVGAGRVVLGHALQQNGAPAELAFPFTVRTRGPDPLPYLHAYPGTVPPLPGLQASAAGIGAFNFNSDLDGVVRRVPLFMRMGEELIPSLAAEALRVGQGAASYLVITSPEAGAGLESVQVGSITVPTTSEGEMWVRFTRNTEIRRIPAWKVLAGQVPAAALEGRIVLIGTSAPGLMDLRFSPLGGALPGVEVHAQALDQILAGGHLDHPNWAPAAELLIIVVVGALVGLIALYGSALVSALVMAIILAIMAWAGWAAYARYGLLLDPATPGLAVLLSFVTASLYHHALSERRQRWVKQAFARYVSPNLVEHLVRHPGELELGGSRRECSFIFTDLAGFTSLMETLDPHEAVALLNEYLDNMIRIAFQHEGTLDRIVGDAVAIMFSAPVEQPDHHRRALACAEAMHRFASGFSARAQARGVPFGVTRIGVHTGEVTVGNFGGSTIFDYRALGDPVNTASRLESVNKQLGTLACVSEATLIGCPDARVRPVGKLVLKGKALPLMVYQPLFSAEAEKCAPEADYAAAYERLAADAPDVLERFAALVRSWPGDALARFHLDRLESGQRGDVIVFSQK